LCRADEAVPHCARDAPLLITDSVVTSAVQGWAREHLFGWASHDLRLCVHPPARGSNVIQGSIAVAGMKVHGECAMGHVEVEQSRRCSPPREASIRAHKVLGKIPTCHSLEIHGEERDVRELVPEPQIFVELEAVDQAWPVPEAEDRVRPQVPVSVDDVAFCDPALEQLAPPLEIARDEGALSLPDSIAEDALDKWIRFVQVRLPSCCQSLTRRLPVDVGTATGLGMKGGENVSGANQLAANVCSSGDEGGQLPVARQSTHHDRGVNEPAVSIANLIDPEVDVGGQPPVERHLLTACLEPQLGGREIREWKLHRLLALAHNVTVEAEHGDVGLDVRIPRTGLGRGGSHAVHRLIVPPIRGCR
jgi:hypothetical protein